MHVQNCKITNTNDYKKLPPSQKHTQFLKAVVN